VYNIIKIREAENPPTAERKRVMYKDFRYINAGENEFYRWGRKAQEKLTAFLTPNENGFYSMPADGRKYYTIGTSNGKFGEFARYGEKFLSVNKAGFVWAKVGTEKADVFVAMVNGMLDAMRRKMAEGNEVEDDDE